MLINNPNVASESFLAAVFLSTHGETLILFDNFNSLIIFFKLPESCVEPPMISNV